MKKNRSQIGRKIYLVVSKYLYIMYKRKNKRSFRDDTWKTWGARNANNRKIPIRSFNDVASNRVAKNSGLIYKGFGLQAATLPFPHRDRRRSNRSARPGKGFVRLCRRSISARRFNFCRPTRALSLHSIPRSTLHPLRRPAIHIANARFHYFRSGDGLTPPIQNYHAVYNCCIRSRRKLRLPLAMRKNDLWRNHIVPPLSFSLLSEETLT